MAEKKMKNPCWKGYEAYGMKTKNGKEVPNCVPIKEEIKTLTKHNIISNLLEGKMKGGPGKASQRPKSWDKGTKSGSEKRKMREEGKREAREMNEEAESFDAAKKLDSHIRATRDLVNPEARGKMPSEFYAGLRGQGVSHEEAYRRTQNMYGLHPPVQWPSQSRRSTRRSGGRWMQGPNGPSDRVWTDNDDPDAYDKRRDGYYEESYYNLLKNRIDEEWENREQQRTHAPHEYAIPDDIADYESEEKLPHDPVHAEHYENATKELNRTQDPNDPSYNRSTVARSGIAAALALMGMSRSDDPILRRAESLLRGHHDALNDHFKLSRQKDDVRF